MSKAVKEEITSIYESLKALYFSGKVKPSLNKIIVELKSDPENLDLTLLACQCLTRGKDYEKLVTYADLAIQLNPQDSRGYYYKGVALQNTKGTEQEALKNFTEALELEPENVVYLKDKATTHLLLFTDYHLPLKFADKHREKGEELLLKVIELVEQKENATFTELLAISDVCMIVKKPIDGKKYYLRAVSAFEEADPSDQDKNIYKDIIKAQKACVKITEQFNE